MPASNKQTGFFNSLTGKVFSSDGRIFITCLLLAVFLWTLTALNEYYSASLLVNINYHNKPEGKVFVKPLPDQLSLRVYAKGWDLVGYKLRGGLESINFDLENHAGSSFILTSRIRHTFQDQLSRGITVNQVWPDTIPLQMANELTKTVPVKLELTLNYEKQYALGGPVLFEPDSIKVTGPASIVSQLQAVETQALTLNNLNKVTTVTIKLKNPPEKSIHFRQKEIKVTVPVFQLTEQTIEIPVEIINPPSFTGTIKLIPEKATLTFQATLNHFSDIKPEQFQAVVDGSQIDTTEIRPLKVQIISQPEYTYNLRLREEYVDYLINK